jgi:hypothetical protein
MLDAQPTTPSATPATINVSPTPSLSSPQPTMPSLTPAPTVASSSDWTSSLSEDVRGYVQNKGFKDPGAAIEAYRNLEKLRGVPEDRLLKLPEKDDDTQGWDGIYQKLGKPATPEGYKVQTKDAEFGKWAQGTFHELGLSTKQAEKLMGKWNAYAENLNKGQLESYHQKVEQDNQSLKTEWGQAFDQNIGVAQRAARGLGFDATTIDALEKSMGFSGVMKLMHGLGAKMGEGNFVSGDARTSNFTGAMTPEAAKNRITALRSDPTFVQKYTSGDASAKEEMEKLHRFAYS